MFRQVEGHSLRVKRPTGPELYEDASRILDELLHRELDDTIGAGHRRRGDGAPGPGRPRRGASPMSSPSKGRSETELDSEDDDPTLEGAPAPRSAPLSCSSGDIPVLERTKEEIYKKAATKIEKTAEHEGGETESDYEDFACAGSSSSCSSGDSEDDDPTIEGAPLSCSSGDIPVQERTKEEMYKKAAMKIEKMDEHEGSETESGYEDVVEEHSPPPHSLIRARAPSSCSSGDSPVLERTKEEMYKKAATKIEKTAKHEGGDCKSKTDWEQLEREIVEILREMGDKYKVKIEGDRFVWDLAKDTELYKRFKVTIQLSLGNEVSWNHLAVLFYTAKGVMTSVGKGTRLASTMKEMTLRYFSDICAGWIMDQGGFDSVLSDSDSELD